MKALILLLLFCTAGLVVKAQNFFPLNGGDKYQYQIYDLYHIENTSYSNKSYSYPKSIISDSLLFQGITYHKFANNYYAYDSSAQSLSLYKNGNIYEAVDFNQAYSVKKVLYYDGIPREWTSEGRQFKYIQGKNRFVYKMWSDTGYNQPGAGHISESWVVEFADEIGLIHSFYRKRQIESAMTELWEKTQNLIAGSIDGNTYNLNYVIALLDTVKDRPLDAFPYQLGLLVEPYYKELVSKLYADFHIYRGGSLVSLKKFFFDKNTLSASINFNQGELQVNDSIKFVITLEDTSLFNNTVTSPASGWYSYKINSPINVDEDIDKLTASYELYQNYPNPFNPTTTIRYSVPGTQHVQLKVYNLLGSEIALLVDEVKSPGIYNVDFDSKNLSSGLYFYSLTSGSYKQTKKMIILK